MEKILNITNGDSAVIVMQQAGIPGEFLPWRDVLHEGPVPADLILEEVSEVRAEFIVSRGWGEPNAIQQSFIQRDDTLASYHQYDKVILWFEHDLYDQLQILQILDWFAENYRHDVLLSMICTEQYLGPSTPEQIKQLAQYETPVTTAQLTLARTAWQAFRSSTPQAWYDLLAQDTSALPFLQGAIMRLLQEFPSTFNGFSRTAQQALQIIASGESRPGYVFSLYQETEPRRFLGDASFWVILWQMLEADLPLLQLPPRKILTLPTRPDQQLTITGIGKDVLQGKRNWLDIVDIDKWIGGVHLTPENLWCWDAAEESIKRKS